MLSVGVPSNETETSRLERTSPGAVGDELQAAAVATTIATKTERIFMGASVK